MTKKSKNFMKPVFSLLEVKAYVSCIRRYLAQLISECVLSG